MEFAWFRVKWTMVGMPAAHPTLQLASGASGHPTQPLQAPGLRRAWTLASFTKQLT